jgi:hypothetical protein
LPVFGRKDFEVVPVEHVLDSEILTDYKLEFWPFLGMLHDLILGAAWRHLDETKLSPEAFAREAVAQLRVLRAAFAKKECRIVTLLAFTGVALPPGCSFRHWKWSGAAGQGR